MTEQVHIPTFKLNNGRQIPAVGYGTWLGVTDQFEFKMSDLPRMLEALSYAIDVGYRYIDTAHAYRIEPEIGDIINEKINKGVVKREDIFVTTKVWQHFHRPDDVEVSLRGSLRRLDLDYVDMLLLHWPFSVSQDGVDEKIDYIETWRGFESVLTKGLTKGIGVSNFNLDQMQRLLDNCKVKPAINQIEVNLNLGQSELVEFCKSRGVLVVAYSPLGTMIPDRAAPNTPEPKLDNATMIAIANKYGKTVIQVAFRYLYQRGLIIIPKTITKSRVLENAAIFDFHLEKADVDEIAKFDVGFRTIKPVVYQECENYPFEKIGVQRKLEVPLTFRKWKNGANQNID